MLRSPDASGCRGRTITELSKRQPKCAVGAPYFALLLAAGACSGPQSALDVRGRGAQEIAELWWILLGIATVVYIAFLTLLVIAIARRRGADAGVQREGWWLIPGGVVVPAIILTTAFLFTERTASVLHAGGHGGDLVIRVTGWMWWWEVEYRGASTTDRIASANEIHIPTGRRVRLELTTGDVIHAFWVPNLQGKMDLVPGRTNTLWLETRTPGISRGQCAEYCGIQHARMALTVVAHLPAEFTAWLGREQQPGALPADSLAEAGLQVFRGAGCAYCHMVRGTNSLGRFGPDLTHVASRLTLAAGTLSNTPEHLGRWIVNAQGVKPGNLMPNVPLSPAELQAVLHYLAGLK